MARNKLAHTDMVGKKFGRLTVLKRSGSNKDGYIVWECLCECGNITHVAGSRLRLGRTKSCGCLRIEASQKALREANTTHGLSNHLLYYRWKNMKERCYNPKNSNYHNYGGRNITVCETWKNDFQSFYDWCMSNGYEEHLQLDRIDVNGNYCPENCRFVTTRVQGANKRTASKYGVGIRKYRNKFKVTVTVGSYESLVEAQQAQKSALNKLEITHEI